MESNLWQFQDSIGLAIANSEQTINNSALQLASIDPNSWLWQLQQFGEKTFAAAFFIAFLQAMLVWLEYGQSSTGVLVIPPGPTHGIELPPSLATFSDSIASIVSSDTNNNRIRRPKRDKDQESDVPLHDEKEDALETQLLTRTSDLLSHSGKVFPFQGMIKTMNKYLALLIPWTSNAVSWVMEGNLAIFHLGFLYSLAQLYDVPNRFFLPPRRNMARWCRHTHDDGVADTMACPTISEEDDDDNKQVPERIVVLGDSLALGIGCVQEFETGRSLGYRAENLSEPSMDGTTTTPPGPVFPRVFANVLAKHGQRPVHWRSAGVDGGDIKAIHDQCLGVIQEEVDQGRPPDLVILITGVNDLKYFSSNPLQNAGPHEFRTRLTQLIRDIWKLSPTTQVILPELRVFHQNSPLNVFPLGFFLDRVLGFWDSQKRLVADRFPDSQVQYIGVSSHDVEEWQRSGTLEYGVETELAANGQPDMSLISADGVHPNTRCYAHWAATLAKKFVNSTQKSHTRVAGSKTISSKKRGPSKAFVGLEKLFSSPSVLAHFFIQS
jgi:lysophospholipase L1-like esterase